MRLTVFGATGKTGQLLVQAALQQGHEVTAYARNPGKLKARPGLTVVKGELDDQNAVRSALTGADAVISLLGPGRDKVSIGPLVAGMQAIVDQMTEVGLRRLVATSTPSASHPAYRRDLRISAMVTGIHFGMGPAYRAIVAMADVVRSSPLDWTLVRLPLLHDKPVEGRARPRQVGEPGAVRLSRAALAEFLLQETAEGFWKGRAPLLADR